MKEEGTNQIKGKHRKTNRRLIFNNLLDSCSRRSKFMRPEIVWTQCPFPPERSSALISCRSSRLAFVWSRTASSPLSIRIRYDTMLHRIDNVQRTPLSNASNLITNLNVSKYRKSKYLIQTILFYCLNWYIYKFVTYSIDSIHTAHVIDYCNCSIEARRIEIAIITTRLHWSSMG